MDYTALKTGTIERLIAQYGKAVSLRRPGTTAGYTKSWNTEQGRYQWEIDAAPGTYVYVDPAATPVDIAGHAVEKKYKLNEINNTTILASDRRFITADLPFPTQSDKLVIGTTVLNIVNVMPTQPGDVTLVWELQCRQ